ncbi:uncharacterized protein LOC115211991 isoform X1 [Argonauta hians]
MKILKLGLFSLILLGSIKGSMNARINITQSGIPWLGENLTLTTEIFEINGTQLYWENEAAIYECDRTCYDTNNFKVTRYFNYSTLWIRSVKWTNSRWYFRNKDNRGLVKLDIKAKPKIEMNKTKNCEYEIEAQCSLPKTEIKCFQENVNLQINENTRNCSDGKTFTTNVQTNVTDSMNRNLTCVFNTGNIFTTSKTIEIECNMTKLTTTIIDTTTEISTTKISTTEISTTEIFTTEVSSTNASKPKTSTEETSMAVNDITRGTSAKPTSSSLHYTITQKSTGANPPESVTIGIVIGTIVALVLLSS